MDTNKAAYWIAVGVLALGLHSEYQQGHFLALHRVADRAVTTICHVSTQTERTLVFARLFTASKARSAETLMASVDRAQMARDQARDEAERIRESVREQMQDEIQARTEVMRAQAEVQRARMGMERIRFETRDQFRSANTTGRRVMVICPKTGMRIALNADDDVAGVSAEVEDANTF
jgi:hypothetical protein